MPNVEMVPLASSNINSAGYDDDTRELHVEFSSGGTYVYSGVPREVYEDLINSASAGSFLHHNIKNVYQARRA